MTKLLDQAIEAARRLPPGDQDDIARAIMQLAGADEVAPMPLMPEERDAVAKSKAAAARGEFATDSPLAEVHIGPRPTMNSAVSDSVKGFLNTISASHSERPRSLAPPTSISSQSLIALNSTDAEGPKLNFLSGKPHSVAPPSAMIANGSLSSARIFSEDKSKATATPKSAMPLFILPCPRPIPSLAGRALVGQCVGRVERTVSGSPYSHARLSTTVS